MLIPLAVPMTFDEFLLGKLLGHISEDAEYPGLPQELFTRMGAVDSPVQDATASFVENMYPVDDVVFLDKFGEAQWDENW